MDQSKRKTLQCIRAASSKFAVTVTSVSWHRRGSLETSRLRTWSSTNGQICGALESWSMFCFLGISLSTVKRAKSSTRTSKKANSCSLAKSGKMFLCQRSSWSQKCWDRIPSTVLTQHSRSTINSLWSPIKTSPWCTRQGEASWSRKITGCREVQEFQRT